MLRARWTLHTEIRSRQPGVLAFPGMDAPCVWVQTGKASKVQTLNVSKVLTFPQKKEKIGFRSFHVPTLDVMNPVKNNAADVLS